MAEDTKPSARSPRPRRRAGLAAGVLLLLVAVGAGIWWSALRDPGGGDGSGGGQQQAQGGRSVTVTAGEAEAATWQPRLRAVGTLSALQSIDVTSEVPGQVEAVRFQSGDEVAAGDVLLTLEADQDRAQLADLEASRDLAGAELARQRELAGEGFAAEAELDRAQARYASAEAQVAAQQERITEKTITAPFAGKLGIREINEGAYVQPGEPIVSLSALDPIRVIFTLPQQQLARVETGQTVEVGVSSYPDRTFQGVVRAIDPVLDRRTRTVQVEAEMQNDGQLLRPGMFADVTIRLPEQQNVVTVPQSALSYNPYGDFVFLVTGSQSEGEGAGGGNGESGGTLTAERRFVTAGERRGTQIAIVEGLEAGQRVVTSGLHKLQDGVGLTIDNSIVPPSVAEVEQVEDLVPPVGGAPADTPENAGGAPAGDDRADAGGPGEAQAE
ncbi:efflux RND transporter periplasmic adaptor subunit [Caenispirillum bisanense]|uniref:Membrane fusion protein, multidrug efflux system n=1 Tax=Caenispirillum bisanense TaxID=414052 RepID=A0A286GWM6_9PROT|nr:efflux RND transporter periplasmic adaptor subunit [Caenispirillum bisanense]SOD99947.1 membrane fusion protein, multidrug efflux system [Caenispirillum bisanense]